MAGWRLLRRRSIRSVTRPGPAVATRYGMVRRMDRGGARLLETLDDLKLAENTVVLLASDNGPWKLYWPEIPEAMVR